MCGFPLVHAFGATFINDALGIAQNDVFRRKPEGLDEFDAGDRRRTCPIADKTRGLHVAPGDVQRIDQPCGRDDGGAMLIVMEDRDIHYLAQALLDDETVRRLDILEIDAAEGRTEEAHTIDELLRVRRIDLEVNRVDVREPLEQDRFALHHRLRCERPEVSEAENGRTVGNHGHHVAARRVVEGA
ncbi:hypothetical protein D9M68_594830 [compost metagenome]